MDLWIPESHILCIKQGRPSHLTLSLNFTDLNFTQGTLTRDFHVYVCSVMHLACDIQYKMPCGDDLNNKFIV